ncbi:hypothetical protein N3K66_006823 [Trichothecium roseum]|uniref:Uncharacterized protein n=1 Tax=Trichothecium roseum TaxID=47278 RepID=A0ACC0UX30_9HYPO|nr:hypothetical protein N3K66_006823 [Trichothecium roseum]
MTHLVRLALALAAALPLASAQLITCYAYDGSVHANQTRCPGSNACCNPDATCLGNRLCHNDGYGPETLIRGPCAVEEYDSGTCAPICLYDEKSGLFPRVTVCSDGSLCCNDDEQCCSKGNGVFIDNDGRLADSAPETTYSYGPERTQSGYRTNTHSSTTSISATDSTSAVAETTLAGDSDDDDDDGQGLKIGLGVGIPVAALLLGAIAGLFFWRRRRAAKHGGAGNAVETDGTGITKHQPAGHGVGEYYKPVQQSPYGAPAELDSGGQNWQQASELGDNSWSGNQTSGYDTQTHTSMSPTNQSAYPSSPPPNQGSYPTPPPNQGGYPSPPNPGAYGSH